MRIFANRPLATACSSAMAAAVFAYFLPLVGKLIFAAILSFVLCFLTVLRLICAGRSDRRNDAMLTLLLVWGMTLFSILQSAWYFDLSARVPESVADTGCEAECIILEENGAGSGYAYYTVRVTAVNGVRTDFRASLECVYTATFHTGDMITAEVQAHAVEQYLDKENITYAIADEIRLVLTNEDRSTVEIIGHRDMSLRQCFERLRDNLSIRLLKLCGKYNGGLATALFLGERTLLDDSISTYFRRSGVSHLLALSGMHVTILLSMLTSLTTGIHIPKRGRALLLSVLAIGYLALTGFRISAIRAVGMVLLYHLAEMIGTRHDPLTTLCTVGMLMMTVSPATVVDGGFWMSFSAVFGLVTVLPVFNDWLKKKRFSRGISSVLQAIAASCIAVVSVSFLSWLFCGELAPVGILVTALLTPLLTVVLSLIPLVLLLDMLPMLSASSLAVLLDFLLTQMIGLTNHIAHWRHVSISLRFPFAGVILAGMTLALLIMLVLTLRRKILLILPPMMAVLALVSCMYLWKYQTFHDRVLASYVVRSSGSVLVATDGDRTAMIDTSAGSYAMLRDAERAAMQLGATEIDSLVLTHYHRAFVYSTARLAKRQIVRYVYLPMPENESEYFVLLAMRDRLTPLGTEVVCYKGNDPLAVLKDATYIRASASRIERSTQPIITYLLQTSQEILTFSNPSVQESAYYSTFRWIAERTDILILGKDGPRPKTSLILPPNALPRLMLTDSAGLLPYVQSAPFPEAYFTDITCYTFAIDK